MLYNYGACTAWLSGNVSKLCPWVVTLKCSWKNTLTNGL